MIEKSPHLAGLLDVKGVARLLAVSIRQIWKMNATGRMPAPIRLGRAVRWRRAELEDWIASGCPPREQWDEARGANAE